jgi:thiazole synthase ThiGH ThiG subunit
MNNDPLIIAGKEFRSRLIVGTGKYRTMEEMRDAIDASGAEMVTVAIRRLPLDRPGEPNLMDHLTGTATPSSRTPPAARPPKKLCSRPVWHAN